MSTADISVVIPTYNRAELVCRSVDSVLAQTLQPTEIIVVDDGSTDHTAEAVRQYGGRVRYVRQTNAGCAEARNHGVRVARGHWVALLDSDDEWLPHKLECQMNAVNSFPELVWSACNYEFVVGDHREPSSFRTQVMNSNSEIHNLDFFEALTREVPIQTSGMLIRTAVIRETGVFDRTLPVCDDRDMWFRIALRHPRIGYCSRIGYLFHKGTPESITRRSPNRDAEARMMISLLEAVARDQPQTPPSAGRFAQWLTYDFVMRAIAGQAQIQPSLLQRMRSLLQPRLSQRFLLGAIGLMPPKLATPLANYLRR